MHKVKIIQSAVGLILPGLLIIFLSDAPYSHFSDRDAMLKIAFKYSGKRVQECDEEEFIRREAERYAQLQKTRQGVAMDVGKKAGCSRERFPIFIELYIDGEKKLAKHYSPIGIQKDAASFIYDRFLIRPGRYRVMMKMKDGGPESPFLTMDETIEFKPGEVTLLRFQGA
ncbi:MAG: hypothetical protein HY026_10755 [Deltaproteobacteria bacterium]|nr:hypothetical protein [Deltaproteobacteria bacterium]